jgi:GTP-binding protein
MRKPILAIVGRPNVGKSALFNRLVGKRVAIVDEAEGVTRDRLYADATFEDHVFQVIDTGGVDGASKDRFKKEIIEQALLAIKEADVIVLVVDGQIGLTKEDSEVAKILHQSGKRILLAVNKIESPNHEHLVHAFHTLGLPLLFPISATHGLGVEELLKAAWKGFKLPKLKAREGVTKVAIVGRPNVGKSTLINALLDEERAIVSPIAGTTRDAISISFTHQGKEYELVDTAGLRRKKAEKDVVEKFASIRTKSAIEEADIVLLLLEAEEGLTEQEKRIAKEIEESMKPCVILCNKWDLVKGYRMEHCLKGIKETTPFLAHLPFIFISALNGRNLEKIFPAVEEVLAASRRRLTTHQLNKFLVRAMQLNHPPMLQGRRLRIYYGTQVQASPPKFIFFVNNKALMGESYKKYLLNQFREEFGFAGVPLTFYMKGKGERINPNDRHDHDLEADCSDTAV